MHFPKPPKTEKKAPSAIKRTAIVKKADWKPLRRSSAPAAKPARRTPIARSCKPLRATKPPKRTTPIQRCPAKSVPDFAAAEAKRLARKAKRKSDRAIASHGKWPVVDGVMFVPDPSNPRGQREICLTDAAWARAQAAIRIRSKDRCEDCSEPAPTGTRTISAVERLESGTTIPALYSTSAAVVTGRPESCDGSQLASPQHLHKETNYGKDA